MAQKKVVILIIAHKTEISPSEIKSLEQCFSVLGKYQIKLICPEGLDVSEYKKVNHSIEIDFIDPKWQSSYAMFSRLKIESFLYKKYKDYQFILFYELDAWVFRDELMEWCNAGYDYIGAPWVEDIKNDKLVFYPEGGNGGLSLRNVKSHLRVLNKWKIMKSAGEVLSDYKKLNNTFNLIIRIPFILARILGYKNNGSGVIKKGVYEDIFWSKSAKTIYPGFKLAPPEISMKFAFELYPSMLYELNNKQLPFGCHAWEKREPDFWKQFIGKEN